MGLQVSFTDELDLAIRRVQSRAALDVALRHCEMLQGLVRMMSPEFRSYPAWVEMLAVNE